MSESIQKTIRPDFFQIPSMLIDDEDLNMLDGFVYATIYWYSKLKLEKCTASNEKIALIIKSTKNSVANSISRLKKKKYIQVIMDKDNHRVEIVPLIAFGLIKPVEQEVPESVPVETPPLTPELTPPSPVSEHIYNNISKRVINNGTNVPNNLKSLLEERKKTLSQQTVPTKEISEHQHYGLLICDILQLDGSYKGRIMGFIKKKGNGYSLHKKANELLVNQKFLSMLPDERIRYLFGSYKKMI